MALILWIFWVLLIAQSISTGVFGLDSANQTVEIVDGRYNNTWGASMETESNLYFSQGFSSYLGNITTGGDTYLLISGKFSRCGGETIPDLIVYGPPAVAGSLYLNDMTEDLFSPGLLETLRSSTQSLKFVPVVRPGQLAVGFFFMASEGYFANFLANGTYVEEKPANNLHITAPSFTGVAMAAADLDGDGASEIFVGSNLFTLRWDLYSMSPYNSSVYNATAKFIMGPTEQQAATNVLFFELSPGAPQSLLFSVYSNNTYLYRNWGNGSLSNVLLHPVIPGFDSGAISATDFTGDDFKDLMISGLFTAIPSALIYLVNLRNETFFNASSWIPEKEMTHSCMSATDFNSDGHLDMIIAGYNSPTVNPTAFWLLNDGTGRFNQTDNIGLVPVEKCIAVAGVFPNNQYRVLTAGGLGFSTSSRTFGVSTWDGQQMVDSSAQTFADNTLYLSIQSMTQSAVAVDANNDGCLDLAISSKVLANDIKEGELLLGNCRGEFKRSSSNPMTASSEGRMVWADFNSDGFVDLLQIISGTGYYRQGQSSGGFLILSTDASYFLPSGLVLNSSYAIIDTASQTASQCPDLLIMQPSSNFNYTFATFMHCLGNGSFLDVTATHFLGTKNFTKNFPINFFSFRPFSKIGNSSSAALEDKFVVMRYSPPVNRELQIQYLMGQSNRTFESVDLLSRITSPISPPYKTAAAFAVADWDGDSLEDFLLFYAINVTAVTTSQLYRNLGNRTFAPMGLHNPLGLSSGRYGVSSPVFYREQLLPLDYDSDGKLDLFLTLTTTLINFQFPDTFYYYRGLGNLSFVDATSNLTWADSMKPLGWMVEGQFTSSLDNVTDFFFGGGVLCGFSMPLRRAVVSTAANLSTTTASVFPGDPSSTTATVLSSSDAGSSTDVAMIALLAGTLGGGSLLLLAALAICLGILFLLCCCCIVVCGCVVLLALVLVGGGIGGGFLAADGAGVLFLWKRRQRQQAKARQGGASFLEALENEEGDEMRNVDEKELRLAATATEDVQTIPWESIEMVRKLGSGAFGDVLLGDWNGVEVAVKTMRNPSSEVAEEFRQEALMMAKVSHHPCVAELVGICVDPGRIALVMRYYDGGSLDKALQSGLIPDRHKQRVARDVAAGLAFLHSMSIVHRDVAARNVLLSSSGVCKLSDLGMSRTLGNAEGEQHTKSYVGPVRWMAPEAISSRAYSTATDAYAFGMLLYEIWTDGLVPFHDIKSIPEVALKILRLGARPPLPPSIPAPLIRLMTRLWATEPSERPSMAQVVEDLKFDLYQTEATMDPSSDATSSTAESSYNYESIPSSSANTNYEAFPQE